MAILSSDTLKRVRAAKKNVRLPDQETLIQPEILAFECIRKTQLGVSIHEGTPKSSMLVGFSPINHPAMGVPPFREIPSCVLLIGLETGN